MKNLLLLFLTFSLFQVNAQDAISDLESLGLVSFSKDHLIHVANEKETMEALRIKWDMIFDDSDALLGQQQQQQVLVNNKGRSSER